MRPFREEPGLASQVQSLLRVGEFEFDPATGELRRDQAVTRLQPQCAALLSHLAGHAGAVVTRESLQAALWSRDTFVEFEDGLNHAVARLREAFSDSARQPRYIETIPRRGYRLIAPVAPVHAPSPATVPAYEPPADAPRAAEPASSAEPAPAAPPAGAIRRGRLAAVTAGAALVLLAGAWWLIPSRGAGAATGRAPEALAYQEYLKGSVQLERYGDHQAVDKALEHFRIAAGRDPDFAAAHAGLAMAYMQRMMYDSDPTRFLHEAGEAARRAVALDPGLAEARLALGRFKAHFEWDWPGAEREFAAGVSLHPTNMVARGYYSAFLMAMGRFDEAIAFTGDTLAIAPHSLSAHAMLAEAHVASGRLADAIATSNRALAIDPSFSVMHRYLATAYLPSDPARAIEESKLVLVPDAANVLALRAAVAACAGARSEALTLKAQLNQVMATQYVRRTRLAMIETCLGNKDAAFEWLEKGAAAHELDMAQLRSLPLLGPLKDDARFGRLLSMVGLQ
jgi:DNA-binding winged helix-turn-helix (wHTH) protein/tetratricopeptide (TPR) repeat protein